MIILSHTNCLTYLYINIFQTKWNLVLIVKNKYTGDYSKFNWNGVPTDYTRHYEMLKRVHINIKKLDFINEVALFPYTENIVITQMYNVYLYMQQRITYTLPSVFKNKLTKLRKHHIYPKMAEQENVCSDEAIEAATHKRLVVVNILKIKDMKAWQEYGNMMWKYLSNVDTKYVSIGGADSYYWSEVSLISYESRTKFCEMIMSREVRRSALPLRHKGENESQTYTTFQIMECHPIFRGCRPVDGYRTKEDMRISNIR